MAQDAQLLARIREALHSLGARLWERGTDYPDDGQAPPFYVMPPNQGGLRAVLVPPEEASNPEAAEKIAAETGLTPKRAGALYELGHQVGSARGYAGELEDAPGEESALGALVFLDDFPQEALTDANDLLQTGMRWQPFTGSYASLMLGGEDLSVLEGLYQEYTDPLPAEEEAVEEPEPDPEPDPEPEPEP
ncbi:MAG TPA: hypothetical protein VJ985_07130, partial [Gammaproteobacteria bacterium]|nr:hypothetical protein [Gammaproteobacteria bacterium]